MSTPTEPVAGRPRAKTRNVARREQDPARQVAWRTLRAVESQDSYANLVLPKLLRQAGLSGRDAGFATELAYGALRGRGSYDAVLAACVDRPLADVDPPLLDALRLGAHQLLGMRVPVHAAVAATVDLVRADVGQGAAGFANAVLRRVAGHDLAGWLDVVAPDAAADPDGALAVRTSHPAWVVRALRDALRVHGRDVAELDALLAADNERPGVTLAVLPGLADRAELITRIGGAEAGALSPYALRVTGAPGDLPAVRSGRARVADEGGQVVALALAQAPLVGPDGGIWLDLCAGPGGKAALLAATLRVRREAAGVPAGAVLVANEVSAHRVELVRAAIARLEDVVELRTGDGLAIAGPSGGPPGGAGAGYDRILVDAPCTGLGALRRRPEARWRRTPADLGPLGTLQRGLLAAALGAVRPGGVVAYVTCSPHPAETQAVVSDALKRTTGVERLDARAAVLAATDGRATQLGPGPDVQLWPHLHGTDGMFLALLRRTAE